MSIYAFQEGVGEIILKKFLEIKNKSLSLLRNKTEQVIKSKYNEIVKVLFQNTFRQSK